MSNIFDALNILLEGKESEESVEKEVEKTVKSIPVNPDMETSEQGLAKAWEKISKYFYNLAANGGGSMGDISAKEDMDLPDDWLDPKLKGKMSGKMTDPDFEKNKVLWDPEERLDKLKKDVDVNMHGDGDDEFDDFDYRNNEFGDDDADTSELDTDDMESGGGSGSGGSSKSEEEKLQDAINDAIDQLKDKKNSSSKGDSGSQSGSQSGDDSGEQSGGSQSGDDSGEQSGGSQSGSQSGGDSGNSGESGGSQSGSSEQGGTSNSSGRGRMTSKDKKLADLQDALNNKDEQGFSDVAKDIKEGDGGSGNLAGETIGTVDEDELSTEMKDAGISDKDIQEMDKEAKHNTKEEISEDEFKELQKEVMKGLEEKCKKKGGSALAKTIVQNAMKKKITNVEWRKMLKLFLKSKSVMSGDMAKAKNRIKYGHKNHLWRDAVLPTKTNGRGQVQNIYCFVDFSGSVNQDLVYTFLGKVIDLCEELNYTNVVVYGFGEKIVLPKVITGKMLKTQGKDVVLAQTWDYIDKQRPGWATENFADVANEILEIRKKQRDAVYLIFGDAFWGDPSVGPMSLKEICGERLLDRICVLAYYMPSSEEWFASCIAVLEEMVGLKNIITTKASSIHDS